MRYLLLLTLLLTSFLAQASDYAREQKWADEILPSLMVGEPVYLEQKDAHKFLTLLTEAPKAKAALILVHGIGVQPDWGLVGVLRSQLAEHGYTTLSVQMPILASDASSDDYPALFPEADERLQQAEQFLRAKGYKKIGLVSHSMGSRMSHYYLSQHPDSAVAAWVAIGLGADVSYAAMKMPVLDLYGENDLPVVLNSARQRGDSLKGKAKSRQQVVPKTDHFFEGHDAELLKAVQSYLDQTL